MIVFFAGLLILGFGIRWIMVSMDNIILLRTTAGPLGWMLTAPYFVLLILGSMLMYKGLMMKFEDEEEVL